MSIRYEWMHVPDFVYLPPASDVTTLTAADENSDSDDETGDDSALVLSADECVVIAGSDEQLRQWEAAMLEAIPGDEERDAHDNFCGYTNRRCGEHRTVGNRAHCFDCNEWCSPATPCARCLLGAEA